MDFRSYCGSYLLPLLIILPLFFPNSTAKPTSTGSVLFIDSPTHHYLRPPSSSSLDDGGVQTNSMSVMEVGAAVSVLLGVPPPPMLSSASSSKLNEILMPNPFDRPRHIFMLEVGLAEDSQATVNLDSTVFSSVFKSKVIDSSSSVGIELPDEEGISFFSLDGPHYDSYTDKEISDFASSFGGSYFLHNLEPLNGELVVPLPSGIKMKLHMSKKADRKFATGLMFLVDKVKKIAEMKQDLSGSKSNVAELMGGYFDSIKALEEEYGSKDIAGLGMELLISTVSKVFDSLQARHKGEFVAVILLSRAGSSEPQKMLDVKFTSRPSPRWLEEVKASSNSTMVAEIVLVRTTLAWITGIILLIVTFIGVYLLLNMPLTRDTLLYSNLKLD